jgi:hypothetical protein
VEVDGSGGGAWGRSACALRTGVPAGRYLRHNSTAVEPNHRGSKTHPLDVLPSSINSDDRGRSDAVWKAANRNSRRKVPDIDGVAPPAEQVARGYRGLTQWLVAIRGCRRSIARRRAQGWTSKISTCNRYQTTTVTCTLFMDLPTISSFPTNFQ